MRSDIKFNRSFDINKLSKVIFEAEHKAKFDKNIDECQFIPLKFIEDSKCIGFEYTKHKKHYPVSSRDFYEKVF